MRSEAKLLVVPLEAPVVGTGPDDALSAVIILFQLVKEYIYIY